MLQAESPRIPIELQRVFVDAQMGKTVDKAPSGAHLKTYKSTSKRWLDKITLRSHLFRRRSSRSCRDLMAEEDNVTMSSPVKDPFTSNTSETVSDSSAQAEESVRSKDSPQAFLDAICSSRGYSTTRYSSLDGGYATLPTPLQQASFGARIVQAVRESDAMLLSRLIRAGLSPNPCNPFGESIVHKVCRLGDLKLLRVLVREGCSVQITDDFGRTPLHDACWGTKSNFELIEVLIELDPHLFFIQDCRGCLPLDYVQEESDWKRWRQFLKAKQDTWWKPLRRGEVAAPPPLTKQFPYSRCQPDPENPLTLEYAEQVARGGLEPEEATFYMVCCCGEDEEPEGNGSGSDSDSTVY